METSAKTIRNSDKPISPVSSCEDPPRTSISQRHSAGTQEWRQFGIIWLVTGNLSPRDLEFDSSFRAIQGKFRESWNPPPGLTKLLPCAWLKVRTHCCRAMGETQNYFAENIVPPGTPHSCHRRWVTPLPQNSGLTTELRSNKLNTSLAATSQMIPNCGILDFLPICQGNSKRATVASKCVSRNDF